MTENSYNDCLNTIDKIRNLIENRKNNLEEDKTVKIFNNIFKTKKNNNEQTN